MWAAAVHLFGWLKPKPHWVTRPFAQVLTRKKGAAYAAPSLP
jgi:hypothetical protein